MSASAGFGPRCCQPIQNVFEKIVPGIPQDTVWGMAKSSLYSGASCLYVTWGNYVVSAQAAGCAALVILIDALIIAIFNQITHWFSGTDEKSKWSIRHEAFIMACCIGLLVAEYAKIQIVFRETIIYTAVPYILNYQDLSIPLLGLVFY